MLIHLQGGIHLSSVAAAVLLAVVGVEALTAAAVVAAAVEKVVGFDVVVGVAAAAVDDVAVVVAVAVVAVHAVTRVVAFVFAVVVDAAGRPVGVEIVAFAGLALSSSVSQCKMQQPRNASHWS